MSYLASFCCFSPISIAITSLGEERANLSAFRTFVRFVLFWICRFPLPLDVLEGLWADFSFFAIIKIMFDLRITELLLFFIFLNLAKTVIVLNNFALR